MTSLLLILSMTRYFIKNQSLAGPALLFISCRAELILRLSAQLISNVSLSNVLASSLTNEHCKFYLDIYNKGVVELVKKN